MQNIKNILVKTFFLFLIMLTAFSDAMGISITKQEIENSMLSNYLISQNAVQFVMWGQLPFSGEEYKDFQINCRGVSFFSFEDRHIYKIIKYYFLEPDMIEKYVHIKEGRQINNLIRFQEKDRYAILGNNILNMVKIVPSAVEEKELIKIGGDQYTVFGKIRSEIPSSLDSLLITSIGGYTQTDKNVYYIDGLKKKDVKNAYRWVEEHYHVKKIIRENSQTENILKSDRQFALLQNINIIVQTVLLITLCIYFYQMNRNYYYVSCVLGCGSIHFFKKIIGTKLAFYAVISVILAICINYKIIINEFGTFLFYFLGQMAMVLLTNLLAYRHILNNHKAISNYLRG